MSRRSTGGIFLLFSAAHAQHTCVEAKNFVNAQYTVELQLGTPPQTLSVVPDTGSYEVVVSSSECDGCGAHSRFNRDQSSSFRAKDPAEQIVTLYGQGRVDSEAVYDRVRIGSLESPSQSVLLMEHNELENYDDAAYDGIMGLGVSPLARPQDLADPSVLSALDVPSVAICFGQHDGEPGRVELGASAQPPLDFVELPIVDDRHWAVDLQGLSVTGTQAAGAEPVSVSGCEGGCSAIVDSGTSLIAVPSSMLDELRRATEEIGFMTVITPALTLTLTLTLTLAITLTLTLPLSLTQPQP